MFCLTYLSNIHHLDNLINIWSGQGIAVQKAIYKFYDLCRIDATFEGSWPPLKHILSQTLQSRTLKWVS